MSPASSGGAALAGGAPGGCCLSYDSARLRGIRLLGYTLSSKYLDSLFRVSDKLLDIFRGFLRERG